jgi:hypothetical protein
MGNDAPKADIFDASPNHEVPCMVCGETPTVGTMEMCGPCVFGEAETAGGGWVDDDYVFEELD